ncbi:DUF1697 domain-containing protein [Streptococcus saliviloxodontae]|uniref:Uncharacterized protein (DUF1697 family) n=1 Tax=Streptococcus saliviloxodontae TaxID=1349416 RepID=A0ABS2PM79_9STRE|nr:DUF1697 domain-containing protein [Streptococcus saliviloxodontae]MBM7636545.1 uncharacterized protein (DUF1697 family) [Streptococcus saliviloxodontae]
MRYCLLLRGINVGGRNKVVMAELKALLTAQGYEEVASYINSGNLFLTSSKAEPDLRQELKNLLAQHYPFVAQFSLFSQEAYEVERQQLPTWWQEDLARKDALFYTQTVTKELLEQELANLNLGDEVLYFGDLAAYWGKYDEKTYAQTVYHKQFAKTKSYKQVTIRNHKTFAKLADFLAQ